MHIDQCPGGIIFAVIQGELLAVKDGHADRLINQAAGNDDGVAVRLHDWGRFLIWVTERGSAIFGFLRQPADMIKRRQAA